MNGGGKSDRLVVPQKPSNNAEGPAAEVVEERGRAKGNPVEQNAPRTQRRTRAPSAPERIRQAAKRDRRQQFTALLHHVYDVDRLRQAYFALKRDAAAGIDGQTWHQYGKDLEGNLRDLASRVKRGAYRAKPVRRAYNGGDLKERAPWPKYMKAFEQTLNETSRPWARWYAIPADDKPCMRLQVAKIVRQTLEGLELRYPKLPGEELAKLSRYRVALTGEAGPKAEDDEPDQGGTKSNRKSKRKHSKKE